MRARRRIDRWRKSLRITVNGQTRHVADGLTLTQLLEELGVVADRIAVELNRQVVPRKKLAATTLSDGDELEIVTLVGGGSHAGYQTENR